MDTFYHTASSAIIHELLDNEVMIANLDTGIYYSIKGAGIPVWQLITSHIALDRLINLFSERYARDCHNQITVFIDQLVSENLIAADQCKKNIDTDMILPALLWPTHSNEFCLEKYEEMKNLLALDPIHEVDENGWPCKANGID